MMSPTDSSRRRSLQTQPVCLTLSLLLGSKPPPGAPASPVLPQEGVGWEMGKQMQLQAEETVTLLSFEMKFTKKLGQQHSDFS